MAGKQRNQLLITNTWFQHKPLHQATWYCNGDHSRPGHMMDFILIRVSFAPLFLTPECLTLPTMCLTMKWLFPPLDSRLRPNAARVEFLSFRLPTCLHSQIQFRSTLAVGLHRVCQSESPELPWNNFKAAMSDAYKTLPELP